jgi:hypothetical protein
MSQFYAAAAFGRLQGGILGNHSIERGNADMASSLEDLLSQSGRR